jgi:hypothetical protein
MAWPAQPDGDAVATAEGVADRLEVAAAFPVDDELRAVTTVTATIIATRLPMPMSAFRVLRFRGRRGARGT